MSLVNIISAIRKLIDMCIFFFAAMIMNKNKLTRDKAISIVKYILIKSIIASCVKPIRFPAPLASKKKKSSIPAIMKKYSMLFNYLKRNVKKVY